MTPRGDGGRIRDPLEEGEDKSQRLNTSSNREESMTESGRDAFGRDSAVRNPVVADNADAPDATGDGAPNDLAGIQKSASSGTTPMTGERKGGAPEAPAGGVEGESGSS